MNIIAYTFRAFPYPDKLQQYFGDVAVLELLKKDITALQDRVINEKPDWVIGFAIANNGHTRIETVAVNSFHGGKRVSKTGEDSYRLYLPSCHDVEIAKSHTDSFCNWTAYKICQFIEDKGLTTRVSFFHVGKDIELLCQKLAQAAGKRA